MTILLVIGEAFQIMEFGFPHERGPDDTNPIWNIGISFQVIVRIVNILIILKLLRVLADFRVREREFPLMFWCCLVTRLAGGASFLSTALVLSLVLA